MKTVIKTNRLFLGIALLLAILIAEIPLAFLLGKISNGWGALWLQLPISIAIGTWIISYILDLEQKKKSSIIIETDRIKSVTINTMNGNDLTDTIKTE
jgi:hypothetical protein